MLQLYHADMSTCSQKVRLVLAEKDVKAEEIVVDLASGAQKKPEYLKMNPGGYVPTLVHDGHVVPESTVICEYLDDAFPTPALKPADAAGRARMRWWTRAVDEALHGACSAVSIAIWMRENIRKQPKENQERALAAIANPGRREWRRDLIERGADSLHFAAGVAGYDRFVADIDAALAGRPWLAGDAFSLADVNVAPYMNRADELQLGAHLFAGRPNFTRWLDAVRARPAYAKAVATYNHAPVQGYMKEQGTALSDKIAEVVKAVR